MRPLSSTKRCRSSLFNKRRVGVVTAFALHVSPARCIPWPNAEPRNGNSSTPAPISAMYAAALQASSRKATTSAVRRPETAAPGQRQKQPRDKAIGATARPLRPLIPDGLLDCVHECVRIDGLVEDTGELVGIQIAGVGPRHDNHGDVLRMLVSPQLARHGATA